MCQLCQHNPKGKTSVLQEVFHEMEMENAPLSVNPTSNNNLPTYRLPWRERRARRNSTTGETSLLGEILQNL